MTKKIIIWPYKLGSKSAKALAQELDTKRVRSNGNYRLRSNHLVINWGNAVNATVWDSRNVVNKPDAVNDSSNKKNTLILLMYNDVKVPTFTESKERAKEWLSEGNTVFGRKLLRSHSGNGIVIFNQDNPIVEDCPLYTLEFKKEKEYRVHVAFGKVIDVVQKKKRRGTECDPYIWNHSNGRVFAREGVEVSEEIKQECIKAVYVLDLDFGAVDVGVNAEGEFVIFEVNTAPGLCGTSLQKYCNAFKEKASE